RAPLPLLLFHHALEQDADDEELRGRVQRVDVDDRDLLRGPVDRAVARLRVAAHEASDPFGGRVVPPTERVERAGCDGRVAHYGVEGRGVQQIDEIAERRDRRVFDHDAGVRLIAFAGRTLERLFDA